MRPRRILLYSLPNHHGICPICGLQWRWAGPTCLAGAGFIVGTSLHQTFRCWNSPRNDHLCNARSIMLDDMYIINHHIHHIQIHHIDIHQMYIDIRNRYTTMAFRTTVSCYSKGWEHTCWINDGVLSSAFTHFEGTLVSLWANCFSLSDIISIGGFYNHHFTGIIAYRPTFIPMIRSKFWGRSMVDIGATNTAKKHSHKVVL